MAEVFVKLQEGGLAAYAFPITAARTATPIVGTDREDVAAVPTAAPIRTVFVIHPGERAPAPPKAMLAGTQIRETEEFVLLFG